MTVKYSRFRHNAKQTSFPSPTEPRRQGGEHEHAQYPTNDDVTSGWSCRRPENVSILSSLLTPYLRYIWRLARKMLLLVTVLDASVVIVSKPPFTRFLANFWTDQTCTGPPFLYTGPAEPCKLERFSYDLWKMVSVSVLYLFYQPVDEKIKTWPLRFPAKENPNTEKALFD